MVFPFPITTVREDREPLLPALPQQSNITRRQEEPEIPDNVSRTTETLAFRRIAAAARIRERTYNRATLSGLHIELLRLERGAMQHLPQLTYDERMEFIADAARLRRVSRRQIAALLDQASDIMMLRDLRGLATAIEDYDQKEVESMWRRTIAPSKKRQRPGKLPARAAA